LQAQKIVHDLEEQLMAVEQDESNKGKEVRIWMDGAFDMMHFGHMNAFRQGRALGTYLIVGVNSDETIAACKGKPVNSDDERAATVRSCRWVDEVVPGVPYIMTEEYLLHIIEKYRIDYVVHGDDPCIVNGKDVYESAVKLGTPS
jgi:ethanolamine-phosphate cytidylyltransferase